MQEMLEEMGLTSNEARIFLALLETGFTSAKRLIDKTKLHRQLVYDALDALIEKGLVSYVVQSNRRYFKATNPRRLEEYFDNKEEELNKQRETFESALPHLKALQKSNEQQEAIIYKGNKGLKSLFEHMLDSKKIFTIGASDVKAEAFSYHLRFNLPKFHKLREKKRITYRIILSEDLFHRACELDKLRFSKAKVLPSAFTSNTSTNIYDDYVSIILWGAEPFGILVKSKDIAEAQKKHFHLLWKIAKSV